ncbi:hypothetical protein P4476_00815 [Ureibacillus terrenus]|uniref:hypothetical protein n=1 Tax=Ureibacillus terrenus TaxID=118246 RepID=UPI002E1F57B4|nr:hypothetical protein [Ureibacillus terrenus]
MATVLIILLIILQLIGFLLIFILNSKIAKFKDLEIRQNKIMKEMEDAISAYLLEMKEENDRFINELKNLKSLQSKEFPNDATEQINQPGSDDKQNDLHENGTEKTSLKVVPKSVAKIAYIKQLKTSNEMAGKEKAHKIKENDPLQAETSLKEKVLSLHQEGKSIEEIAKITQKGKNEIELLLKFQK